LDARCAETEALPVHQANGNKCRDDGPEHDAAKSWCLLIFYMSISVAVKMEDVLRIKSKRYINFNYLSTSGTPDEEVDYGSCGSSVNPSRLIQTINGVHLRMIVNTK
jgi:hypothetical protein